MMFQDSEAEMQDCVGALGTAIDDADDRDLPPKCAKMLSDIIFRMHLDVFRRSLLTDTPASVEPMTVRRLSGARDVRVTPRPSFIVHIAGDENCWAYLLSRGVTWSKGPVCAHASVKYTEVLFAGSDTFPTKDVVRGMQAAAAEGGPTRDSAMGVASRDFEGLTMATA